jgi:hypothetical protein
MGIELFFRCDGPDCRVTALEESPSGDEFIRVDPADADLRSLTFHSWECLAFYAVQQAGARALPELPAEGGGVGA